jgi:hypothetical protein
MMEHSGAVLGDPLLFACFASLRAFPFRRGAFVAGSPWAVLTMLIACPHLEPASQSHLTKRDVSFLYFLYVLSRKPGSMLSFESLIVGLITNGGSSKVFTHILIRKPWILTIKFQKGNEQEVHDSQRRRSVWANLSGVDEDKEDIGRRPLVGS